MTEIIMVKVEEASGRSWNLNLSYVIAVDLANGLDVVFDTIFLDKVTTIQAITLPAGGWQDAIGDLIGDYPGGSSPQAKAHLILGIT